MRQGSEGAFAGAVGPLDDGEAGIADGLGKLRRTLNACVVQLLRRRAEFVFEIRGGDGDSALDFGGAGPWLRRQVEGAVEEQVVAAGDGGGDGVCAEIGGDHAFHGAGGLESGEA